MPFTFVPIAVFPLVDAIPRGFRLSPLANIRVPKDALPNALAFLEPKGPLALVHLPVRPSVHALTMGFAVDKLALIAITIRVSFHASAIASVGLPLAFVDASLAILHDAQALPLAVEELASVDCFVVLLHAELGGLPQNFVVEHLRLHGVIERLGALRPDLLADRGVLECQSEGALLPCEGDLERLLVHRI